MYTNVNLAAPLGVLLFLGTGFLLFVAALVLVYSLIRKKLIVTKFALLGLGTIAGLYLGVMLLFSFTSTEKVLVRGEEKYFCEIDCHLAYSIVEVRHPAPASFDEFSNPPTASGVFWEVVVKTRFDENTIRSNRGNGNLYPNPRTITVTDEKGRSYSPVRIEKPHFVIHFKDQHMSIDAPLRPGESYASTFVFDLPQDVRNPTLLIRESDSITHFIIGHENSAFHKTTRFQIS